MQNIEHIFFDLDKTLWDFDTNSRAAVLALYERYNMAEMGMEDFALFWETYNRNNDFCWEQYRQNRMPKAVLRYMRFQMTLEEFRVNNKWLVQTLSEEYIQTSPHHTNLVEGTVEILEYLSPRFPLHIITNGFEEIQQIKVQKAGIDHFFTELITSEKVGRRKPDPRIFQYALATTGCTAEKAVMIGDDWEADIQGSLNAGMKAIWFGPNRETILGKAVKINHLKELKRIFTGG